MCQKIASCTHRGEKIRDQVRRNCPSGRDLVPVYACQRLGRCADTNVYKPDTFISDKTVHLCVVCDLREIDLAEDDSGPG